MTRLVRSILLASFSLLLVAVGSSCHSLLPYKMGGNPANLRKEATSAEVLAEMGSPSYKREHLRGETWHYADYWWTKEIWTPHWASWEIYMERNRFNLLQMCGWKLVDPPGQEPYVRSAIYSRRPGGAPAAPPQPLVSRSAVDKNPR